jgi:hypothetical protein
LDVTELVCWMFFYNNLTKKEAFDFSPWFSTFIMSDVAKVAAPSAGGSDLKVQPADSNQDVNIMRLITEGKNPRGIPTAKFIVCAFRLT